MITSLGFTQFVLLSLGILALKVLLKASGYAANVESSFSPLAVHLAQYGLWLYALPLAWVGFATLCLGLRRGFLNPEVARWSGVVLAAAIALVYFYAATSFF